MEASGASRLTVEQKPTANGNAVISGAAPQPERAVDKAAAALSKKRQAENAERVAALHARQATGPPPDDDQDDDEAEEPP